MCVNVPLLGTPFPDEEMRFHAPTYAIGDLVIAHIAIAVGEDVEILMILFAADGSREGWVLAGSMGSLMDRLLAVHRDIALVALSRSVLAVLAWLLGGDLSDMARLLASFQSPSWAVLIDDQAEAQIY